MRDFRLNEELKRLAAEAATRFSTLVASGDQIPFDVAEQEGEESPFYRYEPLTERFVLEREGELRSLPAFAAAREAVERTAVAAPYLEARGEAIPADPGERAARMLTVFIASLWDGCTEFSLDRSRLDSALAVLDAEARDASEADVLIVPLIGLRMPLARLELPHGIEVVRADAIEAPAEALSSEGMGRTAWEPQFLALSEQGEGAESAALALQQLRELISVMRLFKPGGIGLGPYGFAPTGEGRWRRIATGAPATRPGGYRLSEEEAADLAELANSLEARPDPDGALAWAIGRFEMGCARESPLEGLSDHLLALRSVLEGHGPVGASLSMRAAALICDESLDRVNARAQVEKALELERSLMNGAPTTEARGLATWVEAGVRRILREAALGELGADLGAAAEETLIASGLDAGDGAIVGTASDWEAPDAELETPDAGWEEAPGAPFGKPDTGEVEVTVARQYDEQETRVDEQETRIMEPVPEDDEIRITATNWLDEVSVEESTLEWPASEGDAPRRQRRERVDTQRVRHLFPVPEDADWEVRELDYDHYSHRKVRSS